MISVWMFYFVRGFQFGGLVFGGFFLCEFLAVVGWEMRVKKSHSISTLLTSCEQLLSTGFLGQEWHSDLLLH